MIRKKLALLLAVCTVMSLLVPTVHGEEPQDDKYSGENMCIAVLAEGFFTGHESFVINSTNPRITKESSDGLLPLTNAGMSQPSPESVYISPKIPFAYDYADRDADVYDEVYSNDGTAMISAAAGNGKVTGIQESGAEGYAPDAQIFAMKVFSSGRHEISIPAVAAAIEDAVTLGADVILLCDAGMNKTVTDAEEKLLTAALEKADAAGIIVVCPTGDGVRYGNASIYSEYELFGVPTSTPDVGTVSYLGTFDSVLTVGSTVSNKILSPAFMSAEGTVIPYSDSNYLFADATAGKSFGEFFEARELEYVIINGVGTPEQIAAAGDLNGKLAVIERGELSFAQKAINASGAGAVGVIITDNQTNKDGSLETVLDLTGAPVPAVLVSMEDGRYLRKSAVRKIRVSCEYSYATLTRETASVSDRSAYGTSPTLGLKPDITAVGEKVMCVADNDTYGMFSSTRISAAKVAGMCAVLKEKLLREAPDTDAVTAMNTVKSRLVSGASLLKEDSNGMYSPRAQGGGDADMDAALAASVILHSEGSHKIELGDGKSRMLQFKVTAVNTSDKSKECTVDAIVGSDGFVSYSVAELDSEAEEGEIPFSERLGYDKNSYISVIKGFSEFTNANVMLGTTLYQLNAYSPDYAPYTFTLAPGASETFDITVYIDEATYRSYTEHFTNGFFVEGFVRVTSDGEISSIPFIGFSGNFNSAPTLDADYYKGETAVYESTYLYRYIDDGNVTSESTVILGTPLPQNGQSGNVIMPDMMAFSPKVERSGAQIYLKLSLLRTVTDLFVTVTDENGNEILTVDVGTVSRTYPLGNEIPQSISVPIWDGSASDNSAYIYPDGRYNVSVSFRKPYSSLTETLTYQLTVDTEPPRYESVSLGADADGTPILTVNASDSHGIRCIFVTDNLGFTAISTDTAGFDMTDIEGEYLYIDIYDHALNSTVVRIPNPNYASDPE